MKLKAFSILFLLISSTTFAQYSVSGVITNVDNVPLSDIEIYIEELGKSSITNTLGEYQFDLVPSGSYELVAFGFNYELNQQTITVQEDLVLRVTLDPLSEQLSEVIISQRRERIFALRSLKKVEGTAIYAGKKTEVVLLDGINGNLAANAPRQIYSQVVGLNIYENGDAGIQLNIGGRGLDPNRSANFNIRQNNYDISADVLGYPESYYTPPAEALSEIQVIRGAASLQYGTQFGGLINFKFKKPNPNKPIEWISRQTAGSYGLLTSYNSLSGTYGKFSYFTYFNYKQGDGWRPNSEFNGRNFHAHLGYQLTPSTKISGEISFFNYLSKQAGGLTDAQFIENPNFSNRTRNWFDVDWTVYSVRVDQEFSKNTKGSFQLFGLNATRSALGFRTNRVSQPDDTEGPRELLLDDFNNWGAEARILTRYQLFQKNAVLLLGSKYYRADNNQQQGPGSNGVTPDFRFGTEDFPAFERQSTFNFPNQNLAVFGENIWELSPRFSVTPGFRWEYIKTESEGSFKNIVLDLAGNVILDETVQDDRSFERNFVLLGLGSAYKFENGLELYANVSQNYRSVTFSDIRVVNPSFVIDENISDEEGFTADIGLRGRVNNSFSIDASIFGLQYNDRLGEVLFVDADNSVKRRRGNIGDAFIYGLELFGDWNLASTLQLDREKYRLNVFVNTAFTQSEYLRSESVGVEGNKVEFIPDVNLKTGLKFGWDDFSFGLQYSFLSEQFTDATNAEQDVNDNQRGIEGAIPSYGILDFSAAYQYKRWRLEAGVNNLLDESYFTRRATGYPGPGIIPAEPISVYTTLQFKL
ncbi:MAG: TonB-dependent receptor [Bacteroidota bacterium]